MSFNVFIYGLQDTREMGQRELLLQNILTSDYNFDPMTTTVLHASKKCTVVKIYENTHTHTSGYVKIVYI